MSKNEMNLILSNKISIEEFGRIIDSKSNAHEVSSMVQSLDDKIQDVYSDLNKRISASASQKDLSYLSLLLDKKANSDDVNESLQQKANKTTVSNALGRKVNK